MELTEQLLKDALQYGKCFTRNGNTAEYIPELRRVNKYQLGIAAVDMDGNMMEAGDTQTPFTIQSISKIISLIMAIEDKGANYLFNDKVGVEPTGDPFNSIVKLETQERPFNPFINAGAIVVASCIDGETSEECFDRFLEYTRRLCHNDTIDLNRDVYESERETGDRNRSLAYFLKASGVLEGNVAECLDFYFKMCSVSVTARDIAYLSAVLANDGKSPVTGEEMLTPQNAKMIRALMLTCGLYDGSGKFAMTVGFPAKSGVGGGITVALLNHMGIGVFGPALDEKGNSIGGIKMLEYLSDRLQYELF